MHRFAYVAYGIFVASAGVMFVFLEDVESDLGISGFGLGAISGIPFFIALFVAVLVSPLGDRGYVRELTIGAFVTAIVGNIWLGYADTLWGLLLSRGLSSFGIGLFGVAARKALVGVSPDGSGEALGGLLSAAVAGFLFGPALGAALEGFGGRHVPFVALSVALLILFVPTMKWLRAAPIATSTINSTAMLPLLRNPLIRAAAAAQAAVFFNIGVFDATVDKYLTDLGVSNWWVAVIVIVIGSPLLVIPTRSGRFVDQHPRPELVLLLAAAAFVPVVTTLSVFSVLAVFIIFAMAQTVVESVVFPAGARVAVNESGAEKSAVGQGLLESIGQLFAGVSSILAPYMYDLTDGPLGSFGMSASFATVAVLYAAFELRRAGRTVGLPAASVAT